MSPVQQSRGRDPRSVAVGVGGVVIGVTLLLVVFFLAIPKLTESGTVKVNLGTRTLAVGNAVLKAELIARDGPLLFADAGTGQRDVFVQHLGTDPNKGWTAFDNRRPGTDRTCGMTWDAARAAFVEPDACGGAVIPADGGDLPHYRVDVDSEQQVTLNLEPTATPGTSPGTIAAAR